MFKWLCGNKQGEESAAIDTVPKAQLAYLYKQAVINAFLSGAKLEYGTWYNFKAEEWDYIPTGFAITNNMERKQILCNSTANITVDTFNGEYYPNIIGVDGTFKLSNLCTIRGIKLFKNIQLAILEDEYAPQEFKDEIILYDYYKNTSLCTIAFYSIHTTKRLCELLDNRITSQI